MNGTVTVRTRAQYDVVIEYTHLNSISGVEAEVQHVSLLGNVQFVLELRRLLHPALQHGV